MVRKYLNVFIVWGLLSSAISCVQMQSQADLQQYLIVGTGQTEFFNNYHTIPKPLAGQPFYGQDAQYNKNLPSYTDNGNGTISDHITGLMWPRSYQVMSYEEALEKVEKFRLGRYKDWRLPTIKEIYSLILFSGGDVSGKEISELSPEINPFIDTNYFDFKYGANGPRPTDVQLLSSTIYQGTIMDGQPAVFGVNVAGGSIKAYPLMDPRSSLPKKFSVRFVRGNPNYGKNNFRDNSDGTISDLATGLMWQKLDSKKALSWEEALALGSQQNEIKYLRYNDWRLPTAKELQSIVDYSRSPQTTNSAASDPLFEVSLVADEAKRINYPFYWSATTHKNSAGGHAAVYICFGEALGYVYVKNPLVPGRAKIMDVHGAGAQRSDPKIGNSASASYTQSYTQGQRRKGQQGDVVRFLHYARLVRDSTRH